MLIRKKVILLFVLLTVLATGVLVYFHVSTNNKMNSEPFKYQDDVVTDDQSFKSIRGQDYCYPTKSFKYVFTDSWLRCSDVLKYKKVKDLYITDKNDEFAPKIYESISNFNERQLFFLSLVSRYNDIPRIMNENKKMNENSMYKDILQDYRFVIKLYFLKLFCSVNGQDDVTEVINYIKRLSDDFHDIKIYIQSLVKESQNQEYKRFNYYGVTYWRKNEIVEAISYEQEFIINLTKFCDDGLGPILLQNPELNVLKRDFRFDVILWFEFDYLLTKKHGIKLLSELAELESSPLGSLYSEIIHDVIRNYYD